MQIKNNTPHNGEYCVRLCFCIMLVMKSSTATCNKTVFLHKKNFRYVSVSALRFRLPLWVSVSLFTPQNYCSFSTPANNFVKKWDKKNKVACATLYFYAYMPNYLRLKRCIILRHIGYIMSLIVDCIYLVLCLLSACTIQYSLLYTVIYHTNVGFHFATLPQPMCQLV